MANVLVNDLYLSDIADAIREKLDTEDTYKPSEMANAIEAISGGGITPTGTKSITENGTYDVSSFASAEVNVPTGSTPVINPLSVTENGTYTALSGVDGYSPVTVNVPNTYSAGDEGKVVSSGALVAQTSDTVTENDTYDTTLINSLTVNVSGGGSGITKVTGTVTGSGTNTISIPVNKAPDIINIYRSDINNLSAVADRAVASMVFWSGGSQGSTYTVADSTTVSNAGAGYNDGIGSGTTPGLNKASYSNGNVYLKGGNNLTLWSSSLTYNYEFIFFS